MADDTFTKADVDKAIKEAVEEATKGLKTNLDAALDEAKDAKRKLRSASEIKPEDLTAAEDRADKAEAALKEAQKLAKDATTAKEKAEGALKTEQTFTHKLLVENGLREQLVAAGVVHPAHQKAAVAMLSSQVKVSPEGEERVAKVGDKALADFVKEWASGEEGKAFVTAPNNAGGGAPGGDGKGQSGKTMTRSAYNALDQQAQGEAGLQMAKGELKIVDEAA